MPAAQWAGLTQVGQDDAQPLCRRHFVVGKLGQIAVFVKMVFHTPLASPRDEQDLTDVSGCQFFHDILQDRFAPQRQHLFGLGFGQGQKARTDARHRHDRFSHRHSAHHDPPSVSNLSGFGKSLARKNDCFP